jgi:hypothetical protein
MKLAELKHLIERIQGNTFVSMDCVTEPKLSGGMSNPHRGRVTKKTAGLRVQMFNNTTKNAYEAMVNRRRVIEGINEPFKVAPLQWGRHVPNSPFIEHNGGLYIQVICHDSGESHYMLDGKRVEKEAIKGLPKEQGSGRQKLSQENKVTVRTFKLDSIVALRMFGEEAGNPLREAA